MGERKGAGQLGGPRGSEEVILGVSGLGQVV